MGQEETTNEEHLKNLYSSLSVSAQQFEKQCLYIASGAFSLSFAFITDIIPDLEKAHNKWLLIAAWSLFAGVIFLGLVGHFLSTAMHILAVKCGGMPADQYNKKIRPWNWVIQGLNILTILGLLAGCAGLILFIHFNL